MSARANSDFVGFPPPLLGELPVRLPVIAETSAWIALHKPAGVGVRAHPWDEGSPNLDTALNQQLNDGKPELVRRDAEIFGSIYYLEPEISGVALFAKTRDSLELLRNEYGSANMQFRFLFVSAVSEGLAEVDQQMSVDAPLLAHRVKPKMIPSTAKGKKSETVFRCLHESRFGWALWEAVCAYPRMHQVRAHAVLQGCPVMGDVLYGGAEAPSIQQLMPKKRGKGVTLPLFDGIALHLASVCIDQETTVVAELPRRFVALLKRLEISLGVVE